MTTPTDKTEKLIAKMTETQAQAKEVLAASALGQAVLEILKRGEEPTRAKIIEILQEMSPSNSIKLALQAFETPTNT
jgi:hypothetical protein